MARIPIADIPNAPQVTPAMPTGDNLGRVNLMGIAGDFSRPQIQQGSFDGPAEGLKTIARGVQDAGSVMGDLAMRKAKADNDVKILGASTALNQAAAEYEGSIKPGSNTDEWAPGAKKVLDSRLKDLLNDKTLSPYAREEITKNGMQIAGKVVSDFTVRAAKESFSRAGAMYMDYAKRQVEQGDLAGAHQTFDTMEKEHHLWPGQAEGFKLAASREVEFNHLSQSIEADPIAAKDHLEKGAFIHLSPVQRLRLYDAADTKITQNRREKFNEVVDLIDGGKVADLDHAFELGGDYFDEPTKQKLQNYWSTLEDRAKAHAPQDWTQYQQIQHAIDSYDPTQDYDGRGRFEIESAVRLTVKSDFREGLISQLKKKIDPPKGPSVKTAAATLGELTNQALKAQVFGEFDKKLLETPNDGRKWSLFGQTEFEKGQEDRAKSRAASEKAMQIRQEGEMMLKQNPSWGAVEINKWFAGRLERDSSATRAEEVLPKRGPSTDQINEANKRYPQQPTGSAGKVTSFGYQNDPHRDSNSLAGIGAFVPKSEEEKIKAGLPSDYKLRPGDIAVSPDVQAKFKAAGINPMDMITVTLADGSTHTGRFADLTANDSTAAKLGLKPLRGRFDFYNPDGPHPKDGVPVVSFRKA